MQSNTYKLPQRISGKYAESFPKLKVLTNHFQIKMSLDFTIYIYCVKYEPNVFANNRAKLRELSKLLNKELKPKIGNFVVNGMNIFALKQNEQKMIIPVIDEENQTYEATVFKVKKIKVKDLLSQGKEKNTPLMFLNNLFKGYLRQLKFTEIGRSKKYFNTEKRTTVQNFIIFDGFECSVSKLQGGVFLKIDTCSKLMSNQNCLQVLNRIYSENKQKNKSQKRQLIKQHFHNKMVMANYGQGRCWIIQDVVFDTDMQTYIIQGSDKGQTLIEYYQNKYSLKIENLRQPLFIAKPSRKKQNSKSLLVPSFMIYTRAMNEASDFVRTQISKVTVKTPQQKVILVQQLMKKIGTEIQYGGLKEIKECIKIDVDPKSLRFQAKKIPPPKIILGSNIQIEQRKSNNFAIFDKPIYEAKHSLDIKIITFNYNIQNVVNIFQSTSTKLKIRFSYCHKTLGVNTDRAYDTLCQQISKCDKPLLFIILPEKLKSLYPKIKTYALTQIGCNTQVALEKTLAKKGFQSICTKIMIQMIHKLGNSIWLVETPQFQQSKENPILVSIDSIPSKTLKGANVLSFVASMNPKFSKFYYDYKVQEKKQFGGGKDVLSMLNKALVSYESLNGCFPTDIIIMRDGLTDQQAQVAMQHQFKLILSVLNSLNPKPKLIYIALEIKSTERFFIEDSQKRIYNAPSGTFIYQKVVSDNYDFYLIGQQCNRGTVTPTKFKVIYNNSNIEQGKLAHLIYTQCFNYQNWSGSVRLPAPSLYAKKMSAFISSSIIMKDLNVKIESLTANPYFI